MDENSALKLLQSPLELLPSAVAKGIIQRLDSVINYQPVIGIMGKTGAGKSSLCNALFQKPVSAVGHSRACTREPQRFHLKAGNRIVTLIDLPGVGESQEYDEEYRALYQSVLPELDLILWLIKADDRALSVDGEFWHNVLRPGTQHNDKVLVIVSQGDKTEPCREWNGALNTPSAAQLVHMQDKTDVIRRLFCAPSLPVVAVSADTGWQMQTLVETMFNSLPARSSSAVSSLVNPLYRNETVLKKARQDFGDVLDETLSACVDEYPLPRAVTHIVRKVIDTVVSTARSIWNFFF